MQLIASTQMRDSRVNNISERASLHRASSGARGGASIKTTYLYASLSLQCLTLRNKNYVGHTINRLIIAIARRVTTDTDSDVGYSKTVSRSRSRPDIIDVSPTTVQITTLCKYRGSLQRMLIER